MASYSVNPDAVAQAERLIDGRQYVLQSDWGQVQPRASDQNDYLDPLNVKGARAKVHTVGEHIVLEVTSTDAAAAMEIARRARGLLTQGQIVSSAR